MSETSSAKPCPSGGATPAGESESVLARQTHRLRTLSRIAKEIASNFDLERIVQTATDAATELAGAKFGAFFYNAVDAEGEKYSLYTLSGAPREAFQHFGLPRKTALFAPTFEGTATIRSDDIRKDPRYGLNAPLSGMPQGHLPVASYLAIPVISKSGEVHGALFLGHEEAGVFTSDIQDIIEAVATHVSIAIDNAHLIQAARKEMEQRQKAQEAAALLAAIVASSQDAILSKTLNGIITSWNKSAERLFGYTAEEAIGQPVTLLIPEDRLGEEPDIIERIRRGERVEHYETIRRRKDGSQLDISLTISPIRDETDTIVGASKIARDISDRKRGEERQMLLLREMNHRVKNLFALATGLVTLSARSAESPEALASSIRERLSALARAHDLTLPSLQHDDMRPYQETKLTALLKTILAPFNPKGQERVTVEGTEVTIGQSALTSLALLLHEFATNSAKYGALSIPSGKLDITLATKDDQLHLTWTELEGPAVPDTLGAEGFGSRLTRATIQGHLQGTLDRDWKKEGLVIKFTAPLERLAS